jgi:hypothetical protein
MNTVSLAVSDYFEGESFRNPEPEKEVSSGYGK